MKIEKKTDKSTQILFLILMLIFIIILIILIIFLVKNKNVLTTDPITFGIKQYDFVGCNCYDSSAQIYEFTKNGIKKNGGEKDRSG